MTVSLASRLGVALLLGAFASVATLSGCSSNEKKDPTYRPKNPFAKGDRNLPSGGKPAVTEQELKLEAAGLYRVARGALESSDYPEATLRYDLLAERYPFTEYATQGELEKIYVLNRDYKTDEALSAADRFLREHPRHVHADYVQYLKGVIQAERDQGLADLLPLDNTKKDAGNLRKAFDEFALLMQKYPNSRYNEDARARMMDLRNRMASNEMHVVDFYTRRGAWLAAAKRAEQVIGQYPGAPATLDALKTLERSYRELGLKQQADDAARTLGVQRGDLTLAVAPAAATAAATVAAPIAATSAPGASVTTEAPAAPQQVPKKGLMTRFADLFAPLDRSNKEPLELVIPTAPIRATTPGSEAPVSGAPAAEPPAAKADDGAATEKPKRSNRLVIEYEYPEGEQPTPAPETARPATEAPATESPAPKP